MSEDIPTDPENLNLIEILESAPHFSYFTFDDKKTLVQYVRPVTFLPGDFLIHEGETMETVYFIISGKAEVVKMNIDGDKIGIADINRGEIVGETSLVPTAVESTVRIRATEKIFALALSRKSFRKMMSGSTGIAFKILFDVMKFLRMRLNDTSNKLVDGAGGC